MLRAARRTERIVAVCQIRRYQKSSWILRKLLSLGFLGEIRAVEAELGNVLAWPMSSAAYFDRNLTSGGVMFDTGIHVVDLVTWLFGALRRIEFEDDSYGGVETNGILRGTLEVEGRQVPCRIAASWTHDLRNGVRVIGSEGEAETIFSQGEVVFVRRSVGNELLHLQVPAVGLELPFRSSNPFEAQLEDFEGALRSRRTPVAAIESTLLSLEAIEEAYSVRTPIRQPWVEPAPRK